MLSQPDRARDRPRPEVGYLRREAIAGTGYGPVSSTGPPTPALPPLTAKQRLTDGHDMAYRSDALVGASEAVRFSPDQVSTSPSGVLAVFS